MLYCEPVGYINTVGLLLCVCGYPPIGDVVIPTEFEVMFARINNRLEHK